MKVHLHLKAIALGVAIVLTGSTAVTYAPQAQAYTSCPQCATEWTQIMNNVELVMHYAKQVQQYQAQLTQLANEAKNLASLPTNMLGQYQQTYSEYAQTVQQLKGVMGNLSKARDSYQQQYPDLANGNQSFAELSAFTKQWEQSGRQNIEDALTGGAAVLDTMQTSQQGFQQLGFASQSANGALQAMQAGNQINIGVGQELMKLNAQTAMFQQSVLQEQARQQGADQVTQRYLDNAYSGGNGYKPSTSAPAPPLGSH